MSDERGRWGCEHLGDFDSHQHGECPECVWIPDAKPSSPAAVPAQPRILTHCPNCNAKLDGNEATNFAGMCRDCGHDFVAIGEAAPAQPDAVERKLNPREWLCSGGGGFEDGEDGTRACTMSAEHAIELIEGYVEYLGGTQ